MVERLARFGFPMDFNAVGPDYLRQDNYAKAALETVVAPTMVVATAPMVALGGMLSWIDTRRSPLFTQLRNESEVELDLPFEFTPEWHDLEIVKLRSMRRDHKTTQGVDDNRTTVIGKFLRATSMDELLGFAQVLVGDMALVGPRPRLAIELDMMRKASPETFDFWLPNASGYARKSGVFSRGGNLGHEVGGQDPKLLAQIMELDIKDLEIASPGEDIAVMIDAVRSIGVGGVRVVKSIHEAKKRKKLAERQNPDLVVSEQKVA